MINYFLVVVLSIGILAYEKNLYEYYLILSFLFLTLLMIFNIIISKNFSFPVSSCDFNITASWKLYIIFYILSYIPSVVYNLDVIGLTRLLGIVGVIYISIFSLRKVDLILYLLFFLLIPVLLGVYLIQFTVLLTPIWGLIYERNASIFLDPNFASIFLGLGSFLSLIYLKHILAKVIISLLFAVGTFFTYSKAGMLALVLGYFSFFYIKLGWKYFLYFIIILFFGVSIIGVYVINIYNIFDSAYLSMFRFNQGLNERDNLWQFSINYIFENQNLFGVGAENLLMHLRKNGFANSSTHNFYFDTLLSYGILPFIANIFLAILIILKMLRRRSKYLPLFIVLIVSANSVLISFGGISLLSFLFSLLVINEIFGRSKIEIFGRSKI